MVGKNIESIEQNRIDLSRTPAVDLNNSWVFPGLINAHDHLELNLFPNIGRGPYSNSYEWFDDVNAMRGEPAMARVLAISMNDRLLWGGYRNLLSGVTTVGHHNPYHGAVFRKAFPVRVLRHYRWAHSLGLAESYGGRPEVESRKAGSREPFIIHIAEGVDTGAAGELRELDRLGALRTSTVLVHGVGISSDDFQLVKERGACLIWCPSSNMFLFDRTVDMAQLPDGIPVALATDSTLSGKPTLFDELRVACDQSQMNERQLIKMVTCNAAKVLMLKENTGTLAPSSTADLLVLPRRSTDSGKDLLASRPRDIQLVIKAGCPLYGDVSFASLFDHCRIKVERVYVEGKAKLIMHGLGALLDRIRDKGAMPPIDVTRG